MFNSYLECALWSSTDDNGEPLDDNYFESDLSDSAREQMQSDCENFLLYCEEVGATHDAWTDEQLGHDFWLTRNGHGAGFWDRFSQTSCEAYEREQAIAVISRDFSKRNALKETCNCPYHQGEKLTDAAKTFGSQDLYVGDDGQLYV